MYIIIRIYHIIADTIWLVKDELRKALEVCAAGSTAQWLGSKIFLTSKTCVEVSAWRFGIDPKGRGQLNFNEFCMAVRRRLDREERLRLNA